MAAHWFTSELALYHADCRVVLPVLKDASVDSVVTDSPYELGFMGRKWDASGIAYDPEVWAQAFRVLKPGGHLVAFGGTRTYHRLACAIEDAGFEIRDSLHWLYGSGFPKSLDVSKAIAPATEDAARWQGWGTGLKPGHEPITLARKPLSEKTVAANVLRHGTGALNIDGCRVGMSDADREVVNTRSGSDDGQRDIYGDGVGKRAAGERFTAANAGRWPPNVLLTHSADCQATGTRQVKASAGGEGGQRFSTQDYAQDSYSQVMKRGDRPTYAGADGLETVTAYDCAPGCPVAGLDGQSGVSRSSGGSFQQTARAHEGGLGDTGGASRFFPQLDWSPEYDLPFLYQAKASPKERPKIDGSPSHPTVKPLALMRWLCRLITPLGGVVLDPFCGTATTLQAARLEGFRSIGCDNWDDAIALARVRLQL